MLSPDPVTPATLREMLCDGDEIALLDPREEGEFGASHLLYASAAPLSRLERALPWLVPRTGARVVFCDAGEGLAARAAERALALGWTRVHVLDGGNAAAARAGFELFSGVNVPSKAFGEFVETTRHTPSVSADELHAAIAAGEDLLILDSRPFEEYRVRNIPGGISCPGAELAWRVHDLIPAPGTRVIVNCAGRTRSIIGTQSLIDAGLPNPVAALRNGTMGWHLAGHALEEGGTRRAPAPGDRARAKAREAAARVAQRFGIATLDRDGLARWQAQAAQRSLFVLDVRSPEEFLAGHLPGSRSAPGGQLVQETDQFIGTLGARVVLVDDDGVRATMTASWLARMGWREVRVLAGGLAGAALAQGPEPAPCAGLDDAWAEAVSAGELEALLATDSALLVDLSPSVVYREGHVPGAQWALRRELAQVLRPGGAALDRERMLVLACEDGDLSAVASAEADAVWPRPVKVLRDGSAGWRASGRTLEPGPGTLLSEPVDRYLRPYEREWGDESAMAGYLAWELELVEKLERDGTARFLAP